MNILCVTPNVAIDRLLVVPRFAAGRVWRASGSHASCGGKGVNVARALRRLGHEPVCAGLIGGESGRIAAAAARTEGISTAWTWIDGETRTCVVIVDDRGTATVVSEPGPVVEAGDWNRLVADVEAAAREAEAVCICGSLPPGVASDGLARLVAVASSGRKPVWVDTAGDALQGALYAIPSGVKINGDEASVLLGEAVTTVPAAVRAARLLSESGAGCAVVTVAAAGAVLVDGEETWLARPPPLPAVNTVASGDAFLAGLLAGFAEGLGAPEALRSACATGAANAQSLGLAEIDVAVVERLRARTTLEPVEDGEG